MVLRSSRQLHLRIVIWWDRARGRWPFRLDLLPGPRVLVSHVLVPLGLGRGRVLYLVPCQRSRPTLLLLLNLFSVWFSLKGLHWLIGVSFFVFDVGHGEELLVDLLSSGNLTNREEGRGRVFVCHTSVVLEGFEDPPPACE